MNLLPYDKFSIITRLKPAETQERIALEVELEQGFSFKNLFSQPRGKFFIGYITNNHFQFKRVIDYRNSFLPIIKGYVEPHLSGSIVHIKMTLHPAVAVLMCMWLGGVAIACISILVSSITDHHFTPAMLIPFGMFAFGYAIVLGGYTHERNKAKNKLLDLLGGEVDETASYIDRKFKP